MNKKDVFCLLAYLLQYPQADWIDPEELRREAENWEEGDTRSRLNLFVDYLQSAPLNVLQENFVETFDFSKKTTLYLLYPQYGEEPKRVEVLQELIQEYQKAGLLIGQELPDYLPLVLEALSNVAIDRGRIILKPVYAGLQYLHDQLVKMNSPYALLLEVCLSSIHSLFGEIGGVTAT
ncbi:nitrate reductase molybdenum cofactor assembly chaperone [Desulfitobacterium hafniense]|uniref:Nitrate reductase delta chain n=3 Tax=Desulfitobacterium hafniense TaxID=49338 RepID=Q251B7_DESHY|nr:nitrate reductase molybdenum cofactor assembly chaperone [Desulfitobacterium hafniense]KTE91559.1 nitrate reductase [Desulfitobacterium hafniense]BAE82125.1 nitrate reductase delta chain [Desulfitobacterium hafniense Y51]CDX00328.1 Nitrate reductase molybdenum cofactor assembly chaperone NarJ [Desulfitobacterium hafniense]